MISVSQLMRMERDDSTYVSVCGFAKDNQIKAYQVLIFGETSYQDTNLHDKDNTSARELTC